MTTLAAVILTVLAAAGTYLAAGLHYPGLPLTGWLENVPAPRWPRLRLPRLPRARRRERPRHADTLDDRERKPVRMAPRGKHHATAPMRLRRGLDGLLHDPDTGTFDVPPGYGAIRPGTKYEAAERAVRNAWGWP